MRKKLSHIYFACSILLLCMGIESSLEGLVIIFGNLAFSGFLLIIFDEEVQEHLGLTDKTNSND